MYSCLMVNKTLNVNLHFLYVELKKKFTQNLGSLTTFLGQIIPNTPICDQGTYVNSYSQVHILKSRIKDHKLFTAVNYQCQTPMTMTSEPPAQLQQRECFNQKKWRI